MKVYNLYLFHQILSSVNIQTKLKVIKEEKEKVMKSN